MQKYFKVTDSLIGDLVIIGNKAAITGLFLQYDEFQNDNEKWGVIEASDDPLLMEAANQLNEYFHKKRKKFQLPLLVEGTPFQNAVWEELNNIPYGETRSYADIAKAIHNEKAVRAVGQANRVNRIPIIIPCHRVIGKNRQLTGYAGNQIEKKEILLKIEGVL
ncbi:methylated-DNA--[protein]-cysteine S-methyltransferase [Bacillus niameyensis]|uniref:methylated-DNA--[protein]-cysteine S-methyltransferase n=1 Tax=Bacillus niameyensis TaxID=1522308 RepID=UPI000782A54E|nr:methylated-DNA--[protein]-cysteine S-methyltransferase [Bacillus niameyensis]